MKKILPEHHRMAGFTLIEVMIAVVIVAILAAIAYPSYTEQVRKANRADAQSDLLNLSQFMERYYTQNNRYTNAAGDAYPALPFTQSPSGGNDKRYNLTVIGSAGAGTFDPNGYILVATPIAGTSQEGNGVLRLDNVGRKFWDINNDGDFADTDENQW